MSRTHAGYDIYQGEELTYQEAIVVDNHETRQLQVKARVPTQPNAWATVLLLDDVEFVGTQGRNALFWTGLNRDTGEPVQLGAVFRARTGCTQCGGR